MNTNINQAKQFSETDKTESALKLLESDVIDVSRYFKIDEFDKEIEIEEGEFKAILNKKEKCGFEFYLRVNYIVPINYDYENKKVNSNGFYEDCYEYPFSDEDLNLLDNLGYDDNYLKNWVIQYYGKPDYQKIWDGETLYNENYIVYKENYKEVWIVYDYFKIEIF